MLGRDRCVGIRRGEFLGAGTAAVATSLPLVETMAAAAQDPKSAAAAQDPSAAAARLPAAGKRDLGVPGPVSGTGRRSPSRGPGSGWPQEP